MRVKDLILKPIASRDANVFIKKHHYSGKVVPNSQIHFGVFYKDMLRGVLSFGASINKKGTVKTVKDTGWNEFIELNRLAFVDELPKNSESRCISVALKLLKRNYPHIKWVVSFADATQCGDGAIYRASGFLLIGIKVNKTILRMPDGNIVADKTLNNASKLKYREGKTGYWKRNGAKPLEGYQLKYIYLIDKSCKITVPILPFSKIDEMGAGMYKGKKRKICDSSTKRVRSAPSGKVAV